MRFLLCVLMAFPVYAQAPNQKSISYKCDEGMGLCAIGLEDWQWVMRSMQQKDAEIQRLRDKAGCGPWRND